MSIKDIDNRFKKYPRASAVMIEREEWESVKESIASLESFEETFELYGFTWIRKDKNKLIPQTPYQFNILYNDETDVLDIDYLRLVIFKDYSREEVHHIWNDDSFIAYRIVDSE